MIVIGDVHGNWGNYILLCSRFPDQPTVQIGDMGVGFSNRNPLYLRKGLDYFFRGNHDSPSECWDYAGYLGEGGFTNIGTKEFFYVPGAWSIDWLSRIPGKSWWAEEELSYRQLDELLGWYTEVKPDIMLTHECPESIGKLVLDHTIPGSHKEIHRTRTGDALQAMFEAHQPKQWIFGHYHTDWYCESNGTMFRCLNELSYVHV
jgi:hypothetical protein